MSYFDIENEIKIGDIVYCRTNKDFFKQYKYDDEFVVIRINWWSMFVGYESAKVVSLKDNTILTVNKKDIFKTKSDVIKKEIEEYKKYREDEIVKMDAHLKELEEKLNKIKD